MDGIFRLKGTVKHYDWGGPDFIPYLLQAENPEKQPFAEYWMGVHAQDNCSIEVNHHRLLLKEYIADNSALLGDEVRKNFRQLPYLLKILDVHKMLSIQVHPGKEAAEKEFARENAAGIPIDSPKRCYKDNNHKPELMVALSEFWLLHGFKPPEEMADILLNVSQLRELLPVFTQSGYDGLYKHVMEMPQEEVDRILKPLLQDLSQREFNSSDKTSEDHWAKKAAQEFAHAGKTDRGIFSIYLFNLVHLKKGEGIYQPAGVPHAYLEGQNVEIMANSDNVLRGGLTNKHIDVKELLKHVKCEATEPNILPGKKSKDGERVYETTAPDFQLSAFELVAGNTISFVPATAEILLLTEGAAELDNGFDTITLLEGYPSAIAFPDQTVHLYSATGATVYRASVAINKSE